jgi:formate hydrogenlyase subunit 5
MQRRIEIRYRENVTHQIKVNWGIEDRPLWQVLDSLSVDMAIKWVDRFSPFEAIASEWAVASAIERSLQMRVPDRAEHLRAIYLEIQRTLWAFDYYIGIFRSIDDDIRREEAFRLREMIFEIQETLTGSRVLPQIIRLGGLDRDLSLGESKKLKGIFQTLGESYNTFFGDTHSDPLIVRRLTGVLPINKPLALKISLRGPMGQASGIDLDLRSTHPLGLYQKYGIHSFEGNRRGDALARLQAVHFHVLQSFKLLGLFLSAIPAGEYRIDPGVVNIPDGVWSSSVESGPGALYAVVCNRQVRICGHAGRIKPNLEELLVGVDADDFNLALASLSFDFAQADLC